MHLELRHIQIQPGPVFALIIQFSLLAWVRFRQQSVFQSLFLEVWLPQVQLERRLSEHQELDFFSRMALFLNLSIGLFLMFYLGLSSKLFIALVLTVVFLLVYYLEYLFMFFLTPKRELLQSWLVGNKLLMAFGLLVLLLNTIFTFNEFDKTYIWYVTCGGLSLVLIYRALVTLKGALGQGFLWYYIILYFCTVYLVPGALMAHYMKSFWTTLFIK